jgi:trans-aconitate methyltransferase
VDRLLEREARCLTVLDVSASALERTKTRLGDEHRRVRWVEADVTANWPVPPVDVWHDRAVFHFLIDPGDRARYLTHLRHAVRPGGTVILATFAPDGPATCSGLRVQRYDAEALSAELGKGFSLVASPTQHHRTPAGVVQSFCYTAFRRQA